jgi:hypothetical protein
MHICPEILVKYLDVLTTKENLKSIFLTKVSKKKKFQREARSMARPARTHKLALQAHHSDLFSDTDGIYASIFLYYFSFDLLIVHAYAYAAVYVHIVIRP